MNRAADWLKQAERDLTAASHSASAGDHEWAAFQAQQGAEKAVKALIQSLHGAVRGHAITDILFHLPGPVAVPAAVPDSARELDKVYVTSRYPIGFASGVPADYFTDKTSIQLLGDAKQILEFCRSQIP
jgi:HEPN domain-containing protein